MLWLKLEAAVLIEAYLRLDFCITADFFRQSLLPILHICNFDKLLADR